MRLKNRLKIGQVRLLDFNSAGFDPGLLIYLTFSHNALTQ